MYYSIMARFRPLKAELQRAVVRADFPHVIHLLRHLFLIAIECMVFITTLSR
jgi:hypothetical protein